MQSVLYAECCALSCYADWRHFYQLWFLIISSTSGVGLAELNEPVNLKFLILQKKKKLANYKKI